MWLYVTRWGAGYKPSSSRASNRRRYASRISLLVVVFAVMAAASWFGRPGNAVAEVLSFALIAWAIVYFIFVILVIPFLSNTKFHVDAGRLFLDGLVSTLTTIACFGFFYSVWGLRPPPGEATSLADCFYFSTVTFSTLGFGDFAPSPAARPMAALQAVIGNLHLGFIAGSAFFAASNAAKRN